jgi:hypothetical protein
VDTSGLAQMEQGPCITHHNPRHLDAPFCFSAHSISAC